MELFGKLRLLRPFVQAHSAWFNFERNLKYDIRLPSDMNIYMYNLNRMCGCKLALVIKVITLNVKK